jgi:hypothetical protein
LIRPSPAPAILLALAAGAQTVAPPRGRPGRVAREGHILAQYFQLRVDRIHRGLGLPLDRARSMAERWARWDRENLETGTQLVQVRQVLNQTLSGPGTDEEKNVRMKPAMEQYLQLRRQQEDARRKFHEEILANLTPVQQVRMLQLMDDFQARLKDALRESRDRGGRY